MYSVPIIHHFLLWQRLIVSSVHSVHISLIAGDALVLIPGLFTATPLFQEPTGWQLMLQRATMQLLLFYCKGLQVGK